GIAAFVEHQDRVYQILGYTMADRFNGYDDPISSALASFGRVTDRRLLSVEPQRLDIVTLPSAMTLQEFNRRFPSTVDMETLAIINQAQPDTRFPAGTEVKRVVGGAGA
ncbi:MAG TPA: peptidase M48, partial [Thermoanaerobaculia bacterium]|nr:peptidase M48 [Thermoanaerobaculia bacterium]